MSVLSVNDKFVRQVDEQPLGPERTSLQELAILQYVYLFKNIHGLRNLMRDWNYSVSDVLNILEKRRGDYAFPATRQYDVASGSFMSMGRWIDVYVREERGWLKWLLQGVLRILRWVLRLYRSSITWLKRQCDGGDPQ